ncbi:hypothetical protein XENORESO_015685 [Xenotaenia resolanae]|uniref:Uncharacterized protein n=1 Tax=Xenotaenia resolanae TaxID=208358 RepID=A0ABV0WTR7_9TELE
MCEGRGLKPREKSQRDDSIQHIAIPTIILCSCRTPHLGPPVCVLFRPRGGGARLRLGPDDCKDPCPPFFSQSWRGHRAAVSEDKGSCMFWSPEEASYISINGGE